MEETADVQISNRTRAGWAVASLLVTSILTIVAPLSAQAPRSYPSSDLERLVSRIALYPDPLLAQILAAATFSDEIPEAAQWADEHHYVTGEGLVRDMSGTIDSRGIQASRRCCHSRRSSK